MKASVTMRSKSYPDFNGNFEWQDAAALVLPMIGDSAAMYQKKPMKVVSRSFSCVVDNLVIGTARSKGKQAEELFPRHAPLEL